MFRKTIETTNAVINKLEEVLFAILVDKSHGTFIKEQMIVSLHYVDK